MKEVLVPRMGESIAEASVVKITKNIGDSVREDELLFELETDKAAVEVSAPVSGVLSKINVEVGQAVKVDDVLGLIDENVVASDGGSPISPGVDGGNIVPPSVAIAGGTALGVSTGKDVSSLQSSELVYAKQDAPSARILLEEKSLSPRDIVGTGKDNRIRKVDVLSRLFYGDPAQKQDSESEQRAVAGSGSLAPKFPERLVPLSKLRQRIASRLKESQNTAAILTTFNEVDMENVIQIRKRYKDSFEKVHGLKLGFMSFFVQAVICGLEAFPEINAEIRGKDIVYKDYYNIGVAVGTKNGLVVPVIKNAQNLSFAEIERQILEYGKKARDGKIEPDDMQGGTFTISNGGIYGSLMSTPIINPPQSGILGMHAIKERPVVIDGAIVVRPMMYLALSYDHRIVDGREAVSFLVRVKECLENPERLLLKV
ncbi:dihydrolipoyllysine-residue succinyltransferase, E2 component of oxoglutarate dehydrogenase (succinyl-transferring) complex [Neorickettsia risticii str. Illinois]|uniref:Dihydrolipoyllysine-residue succinyltransferase component of 2-oxoglutarate dehydrogenase complex n=1 Tax=Neorickettsia risticii (strain Illinois) TaxID=434131 RepID=C6V539_NEORI|nr:2-oxoglutarate dehydrogenase complex dihydrolipoyllysine-residue succinyltransferase [Neorickettsia risticii]ACT69504.1 dihydrolipoyllysine-residue succinyltransferase, E2 component of oxoglutarate dehydrogenase (succinyl-transferring) complex [Neorickettsia risticii str. Illinois]